jgi:hypothetical protein
MSDQPAALYLSGIGDPIYEISASSTHSRYPYRRSMH